jgi:geranylgeranyl diphosphate synthase type II
MSLRDYSEVIDVYLKSALPHQAPKNLYEPMQYMLGLGGKRIRPVLTLLSVEGFDGEVKEALPAAAAVEIFHNFTLLHDDIMDQAQMRRGKATVHEKWNPNIAILSGDMMLIKAYEMLEQYPPEKFQALVKVLNKAAAEVCEGQQYDMDFESQKEVSLSQYMEMIRLKTAVLLGAALQIGAIIANASAETQQKIYDLGITLGLAFQLQDDYLDTFGDASTFGKEIGGDIRENKKTWLYLKALELANTDDKKTLISFYKSQNHSHDKVEKVKLLFKKNNVDNLIKDEMAHYSSKASLLLENIPLQESIKQEMDQLIALLNERNH